MAKPPPKRGKNKDNSRRAKKKISPLTIEKIEYVDYKDVNLLKKFVSDRSKIRARRVTGNDSQQQRVIARAIKNSREMALLPYSSRVTTQRGGKGERGGDRGRADGPPPKPQSPPPPPREDEEGVDPEVAESTEVEATEAVES
jgi:small subunit ribosomal protein S18